MHDATSPPPISNPLGPASSLPTNHRWRHLHVAETMRAPSDSSANYEGFLLAPSFAFSTGKKVWAPLIEKAFAKIHGCYESIGRGSIEEGLRSLTGAPVLRTPLMGLSALNDATKGHVAGTTDEEVSEKLRQALWVKMKK